jgi:WD40 repeat protein
MRFPGRQDPYAIWSGLAVSADGSRLAIARHSLPRWSMHPRKDEAHTDTLLIYDLSANKVITQVTWAGQHPRRVAFSPDGQLIAVTDGSMLQVWNLESKQRVVALQAGKQHLTGLAFDPDGRYIATVSNDHLTRLWEVGTWGEPKTFEWKVGKLREVAFAPDGATAAVASDKGQIVLFDVD